MKGDSKVGSLILLGIVAVALYLIFSGTTPTEGGTLEQKAGLSVKFYDKDMNLIYSASPFSIATIDGNRITGVYYMEFDFSVTNIGENDLTASLYSASPTELQLVMPTDSASLSPGESHTWTSMQPLDLISFETWSQPVTFRITGEGSYQYGGVTEIRRVYAEDSVDITIESDPLGQISVTITPTTFQPSGGTCIWDDQTCSGSKYYQCNEFGEWVYLGDCSNSGPTCVCEVRDLSTPAPGGGTHYTVCVCP